MEEGLRGKIKVVVKKEKVKMVKKRMSKNNLKKEVQE